MKLSEYIKFLQDLKDEKGDLEVFKYGPSGVKEVGAPSLKHLKILSKRESRQEYWETWRSNCTPENKGEQVVSI